MFDCHVHTKLCRHADGEMETYVQQALKCGLSGMGFCDHMPPTDPAVDWGWTMRLDELAGYVDAVLTLRRQYPQIALQLAIEVDHFPGQHDAIRQVLDRYPFDYVCGSVHFIDGWNFDGTDAYKEWDTVDVDDKYVRYYELLQEAARSGLYNIMAHTDLVKKYGHRATCDMQAIWRDTARVFYRSGVAIEVNTSGLRKPVQEIYPSEALLKIYYEEQVPIVFSSDAHTPSDVGMDFDKAVSLAHQAGYTQAVTLSDRQITGAYTF